MLELQKYQELLQEQNLEEEFLEKDTIRKFQIEYNETICMVEKYPEAMQTEGVVKPAGVELEILDGQLPALRDNQEPTALCDITYNTSETADQSELPVNNSNTTDNQLHVVASW